MFKTALLRVGGYTRRHKLKTALIGAAVGLMSMVPGVLSHADPLSLATSTNAHNVIVQFSLPSALKPVDTNQIPLPMTAPFTLYGNGLMVCGHDSSKPFINTVDPRTFSYPTSAVLTKTQIQSLIQQISSTGYFSLHKEYFANAPIAERQAMMQVSLLGGNYYVLYYNDEPPPAAYTNTLNILQTFCQQATKPYSPNAVVLHTLKNADPGSNPTTNISAVPSTVLPIYQNAISTANLKYASAQSKPSSISSTSATPYESDTKYSTTNSTALKDQFSSQPQQYVVANGTTYELSLFIPLPTISNPLHINYQKIRSTKNNNNDGIAAKVKNLFFPKTYAAGPVPVRLVVLLPSDGGSTANLSQAQNIGAAAKSWYCGQVGSCYDFQGVSVMTGSQTRSYYNTDHSGCGSDVYCRVLNNVETADSGTIYRTDIDTEIVTGWSLGGVAICGEADQAGTLAVVDYFQHACTNAADSAHELGHTFGLGHTCNGTLMDGSPPSCPSAPAACDIVTNIIFPICKLDQGQINFLKYDAPDYFTPQPRPCMGSSLARGQSMSVGQCLMSDSGQYVLKFQTATVNYPYFDSGGTALQLIDTFNRNKVVWTTNCGATNASLTMQSDGNLVETLYGDQHGSFVCWTSGTRDLGGSSISVSDNGELDMYLNGGPILWTSSAGILVDPPATLKAGEKLFPGEQLFSATNKYRLVLQKDGNLVEYDSHGINTWSSRTNGSLVADLAMQGDGNLVLYDINGTSIWRTTTQGMGATHLTIQDDGNIVLYTSSNAPVWSIRNGTYSFPSDLYMNSSLGVGQQLLSPAHHFRLILQTDGNLVLYDQNNNAKWSSGTTGQSAAYLTVQGNSNVALINTSGNIIWSAGSQGMGGNHISLQDDGNLVEYSGSNVASWSTAGGLASFPSNLGAGQYLYAGQQLLSPGHQYRLILQTDGNLVMYNQNNQSVWSSGTNGRAAADLVLQGDSNLVLYDTSGNAIWSSSTTGMGGNHVSLQDDGNLVIYTGSTIPVWSTQTGAYSFPDRLWNNQYLYPGQQLLSPAHHFRVILQTDGNLVVYNQNNQPEWSTGTTGMGTAFLVLQGDGNLVLRNSAGTTLWAANSQNVGVNRAEIQDDGNFVAYTSSNAAAWALW